MSEDATGAPDGAPSDSPQARTDVRLDARLDARIDARTDALAPAQALDAIEAQPERPGDEGAPALALTPTEIEARLDELEHAQRRGDYASARAALRALDARRASHEGAPQGGLDEVGAARLSLLRRQLGADPAVGLVCAASAILLVVIAIALYG